MGPAKAKAKAKAKDRTKDKAKDKDRDLHEKAALFKALADASRLRALSALLERAHCVEELAQRLSLSPSTMSFHLRKLESAGLVEKSQTQYYALYAPRPERLALPLHELVRLEPVAGSSVEREQRRIEQYRDKVVRSFFTRGKLTQLPKQWKKQVIVAEEFLKDFDTGCDYSEAEVSERIAMRFPDYCTIRRILVEEGLMTRQHGIYRRSDRQPEGSGQTSAKQEPQKKESGKKESEKKESQVMNSEAPTRSDLKRQYKETERQAGIFQVRNTVNGRIFLGSSLNLHGPLNKHRFMLRHGAHPSLRLQKDWKELGPDAFAFEIVEVVKKSEDAGFSVESALQDLEKQWLARTDPTSDRGYNTSTRIRE